MALTVSRDATAIAEAMLADAYELVLSGWCQGVAAQDEERRTIEPSSAFARRWSAPGALERVWRRAPGIDGIALEAFERASLALSAVVRDVPQHWNDAPDRRLDEVLDALASAVDMLRPMPANPLDALEDFIEDAHRRDGPALFVD